MIPMRSASLAVFILLVGVFGPSRDCTSTLRSSNGTNYEQSHGIDSERTTSPLPPGLRQSGREAPPGAVEFISCPGESFRISSLSRYIEFDLSTESHLRHGGRSHERVSAVTALAFTIIIR